jgi:large subunit ribosomal protein L12
MEYVYAAMLLHAAEKDIDEKAVGAVLKAAGVKADDARVKALVASLAGVDIAEAMTQAVAAPAAAAPASWLVPHLLPLTKPLPLKKKRKKTTQCRIRRSRLFVSVDQERSCRAILTLA